MFRRTHSKRISPLFLTSSFRSFLPKPNDYEINRFAKITKDWLWLIGNVLMIPSFRAAQKLPLFEVATGEEQGQRSLPAQRTTQLGDTNLRLFQVLSTAAFGALVKQAGCAKKPCWNEYWIFPCAGLCANMWSVRFSAWLTSKAASFSRPWAATTFLACASTVICV